jgi:hypothetical protein
MAKRTKYVYQDNSKIAHLWVGHNLSGEGQSEARNPQKNFYFTAETIYSYGSHFPIAKFVRSGKRQAIQFTTCKYSVTTSQHISIVRDAIRGNAIPVFNLYNPTDYRKEDIESRGIADYISRINEAIKDQNTPRIQTRRLQASREEALELITECKAYCKFWKIKFPKFPKVPALPANFGARRERELELEAARKEKKEEARKIARAQWEKDNAEKVAKYKADVEEWNANFEQHITNWLAGGELNEPNRPYNYYDNSTPRSLPTLLRIKGNEVETSRYASFPIDHAKRGLALVRAVMTRGQDWAANGHTCKLGLYQLSRIEVSTAQARDAGGALVFAGCHIVPWESIARIAPALDAFNGSEVIAEA